MNTRRPVNRVPQTHPGCHAFRGRGPGRHASRTPLSPQLSILILIFILILIPACRKPPTTPAASSTAAAPTATAPVAALAPPPTSFAPDDPVPTLPPTPDISLTADDESPLTILQGSPLIFTVRIANQRAANALALNAASDPAVTKSRTTLPVPALTLAPNWPTCIRLEARSAENPAAKIALPLTPLAATPGDPTLDGTTTLEASSQLTPEAAAKLPAGSYLITATLDTTSSSAWQGAVTSSPLALTIKSRPTSLAPADASIDLLRTAHYFAALNQWPPALAAAQKAVALTPDSVEAQSFLGDALSATNDKPAALAAYAAAIKAHRKLNPDPAAEPPTYVLTRMRQLAAGLSQRSPAK